MSRSERRKTMPEPAGAGMRRMETAAPECRPTPLKSREEWIVCSSWGEVASRESRSITADEGIPRVAKCWCGNFATVLRGVLRAGGVG